MTDISAQLVKELREATNAGMMACKNALLASGGDQQAAMKLLRERGVAIAQKKAARSANQGVVAASLAPDGAAGSLVEINCETDFVAKNPKFLDFARRLAERAAAAELDADALAAAARPELTAMIAEFGENIVVRRSLRYALQGPGQVAAYVHHGNLIGVLLEAGCQQAATAASPVFQETAKDLCLHVAAANPRFLDRAAVPADVLTAERDIYARQITGKPPNIVAKIVEGKLNKFYEQVCLLDQPFVKDQDQRVAARLKTAGAALHDVIAARRFARFQVGERPA